MLWIVGIPITTDNLKSCARHQQKTPHERGFLLVCRRVHLAAIANDEPISGQTPASAGRY
ncbi:hypothetical protein XFF6166_280055 [Xanthomonas citri pv. fuscans]|nr:hypothetical protein XFF6166_280055 [Xanthomonas citri pv. fuscans]SON99726.1 hypothetical protein XFF6960_20055 [Xanthomonas citri pv. fuscans]SOO05516.1 hypothetical protein XFF7767_420056 [Xanthomonas citri pv. fuscans]SOO08260.1 hypothetical protein XFF6970_160109 [Xanthomonas citri pv. fuscans]SOO15358.1 hypothetical protein XFF7766_550002 [Xanthomonas citri pv. fuscans]